MNKHDSDPSEQTPVVGGIYSIQSGDGQFGVTKVLVVDETGVHVCLYRNKFPQRPAVVDVAQLSLGSIFDSEGYGIGHIPLSHAAFSAWAPVYLTAASVSDDELEGYSYWREAQGGVFGEKLH